MVENQNTTVIVPEKQELYNKSVNMPATQRNEVETAQEIEKFSIIASINPLNSRGFCFRCFFLYIYQLKCLAIATWAGDEIYRCFYDVSTLFTFKDIFFHTEYNLTCLYILMP